MALKEKLTLEKKKNRPPNTAFNKDSCTYPAVTQNIERLEEQAYLKIPLLTRNAIYYLSTSPSLDYWLPSYEHILDGLSTVILP